MVDMEREISEFARKIQQMNEYQNYEIQKEKVCRIPNLKDKIDEFRAKNFELQHSADNGDLLERMEAFEAEYENFRADPLVDDFLSAELSFCRMMQKIYANISEKVDFD